MADRTKQPRCTAERADGKRCRGWAVMGSAFCIAHSKDRAQITKASRQMGARVTNGQAGVPESGPLDSWEACDQLLDKLITGGLSMSLPASMIQAVTTTLRLKMKSLPPRQQEMPDDSQWVGMSSADLKAEMFRHLTDDDLRDELARRAGQ
jgi:hypothetical protein